MIYIVKSGDTLSAIAQRHLGNANRWPEIARLNSLSNPDLINPGDELRLPDAGSKPTASGEGFFSRLKKLFK
jgi:nucleoid-associated protein YgaU